MPRQVGLVTYSSAVFTASAKPDVNDLVRRSRWTIDAASAEANTHYVIVLSAT